MARPKYPNRWFDVTLREFSVGGPGSPPLPPYSWFRREFEEKKMFKLIEKELDEYSLRAFRKNLLGSCSRIHSRLVLRRNCKSAPKYVGLQFAADVCCLASGIFLCSFSLIGHASLYFFRRRQKSDHKRIIFRRLRSNVISVNFTPLLWIISNDFFSRDFLFSSSVINYV